MSNFTKNILFVGLALVLLLALWSQFTPGQRSGDAPVISYTELVNRIESGAVDELYRSDDYTVIGKRGGDTFRTNVDADSNISEIAVENGVDYTRAEPSGNFWSMVLFNTLPILILLGFWIFLYRNMQGGGRAMGFGKSKAKMLTEKQGRVMFSDVAGIDEAKQELEEIVDFLKDPTKFQRLGGRIPKGVLLVGPPGTGKTLLARAIAGEAGVPFFTISGSDFVEMFVGVGASRVRDMFEQAKKHAPCIVFIDEIDAVGRHRGAGYGGGNDEREQTLNQLLVEMDGFEANEGIILVAATNRPDVLDPALTRPGRFDREVQAPNPDIAGREKILMVHMRKVPLAPDVKARVIARGTPGFSGADLANLVNEAALMAARAGKKLVDMADFEDAKDKVMMGPERRSMVMTDDEKELTAYHEGGHALLNVLLPSADPIHKATIIPRGRALGMVMSLPERDRLSMTYQWCTTRLAIMMGGRVAEEVIFGKDKVTNGASSDIQQATKLARAMVMEWGMSERLGPLLYGSGRSEEPYAPWSQGAELSPDTQQIVDEEVRRLVDEGHATANQIITERLDALHRLARAMLDYETLSGDEVKTIIDGGTIDRKPEDELPPETPIRPSGRRASVPTSSDTPLGGSLGGPKPQPS